MKILTPQPISTDFNIAIIISRFNEDITEKLLEGALAQLKEKGFQDSHITVAWVPGAVEIPLAAQRFAQTKRFDVIICMGAVIQGETKHFDYVCQQVSQGCQQVMLAHDIPMIFGVMTVNDKAQAYARLGGDHGHMGRSAADSACDFLSVLRQI